MNLGIQQKAENHIIEVFLWALEKWIIKLLIKNFWNSKFRENKKRN